MLKVKQYHQGFDWIMAISAFLLVAIGLLSIYSSSQGRGDFSNFYKQVIFLAIGIILMFLLSAFDWRMFRENPYIILTLYFLCIVSLIGLFFFASEIRGVKIWYKIGPISIDPSEFMKLVLIILLAKYFSKKHVAMYQVRHIILSGLYVFLPALLIFLQPNLGTVLILVALWLGMLVISGIKLKHFLILALCGIIVFIFSWSYLLKDYQKARISSFISPQVEPLGINWNQNQAKIAIGSGGIFGKGIGSGSQTQHGFLPEPQNDFIFSAIAEETGLLGVGVLFSLLTILLWRIIRVAILSQTNFSRLFSTGFAILLISQIFIHVAMNLGILPIIGISLPLASYGGSNLITTLIGLGIIQGIKSNS